MLNPNLHAEIKTDFSKRFDAFLRQEMAAHQDLISNHHKEMQALRDLVNESVEKCESLLQHYEQSLRYETVILHDRISKLQNQVQGQTTLLSEQQQTIQSLHKQLHELHELYVSKTEVENHKKTVLQQIQGATANHSNSLQEFQRELNTLFRAIRDQHVQFKCDVHETFDEIRKEMKETFSISQMDKEGVLKEMRICSKSIFIIEKKIEHIYGLLGRSNQGGEMCPKQD